MRTQQVTARYTSSPARSASLDNSIRERRPGDLRPVLNHGKADVFPAEDDAAQSRSEIP